MATFEIRSREGITKHRVKVRLKGFQIETATFDRLTDAKKWASSTESAMREGRYFKTSAARKHSMIDLIDRYIREVLPKKPKSMATQKTQLLWWKNQLGHLVLADVTPAVIVEQRDKLANSLSARKKLTSSSTVNRYMAALGHAFTVAIKEWNWLEISPMTKVSKLKEPRGRVRFLSEEERKKLLDICEISSYPHLYLIVVLALSTGARKTEILSLKWQDIGFERGVITLHETKNGERRLLPITGLALDLLQVHAKIRRLHSDFVFPSKNGLTYIDITTPWESAVKRAGIVDFRFHDLRHSAASYLAMSGATTAEIAEVLGHKTLEMVKRYSHMSESHTAGVVARMNKKVFG